MKFTIPGEPGAKGRPKFCKGGWAYTPAKTASYENLVKLSYDGPMHEGPLQVDIKAYFKIPKSTTKKNFLLMVSQMILPTKRPDWDNIGKIICDALNDIAYHDDSQVIDGRVRKYYSEEPRVDIEIWEV